MTWRGIIAATVSVCTGCYVGSEVDVGGAGTDSSSERPTAGESADGGEGPGADESTGGGEESEPVPACLAEMAYRPIRRLTPEQLRNTQRDLFGDPQLEPPYDDRGDFISSTGVRTLRASAEYALARSDQWTEQVFPCDLDGADDRACAQTFVEDFGTRAFRRAMEPADVEWLMAVYDSAIAEPELGFKEAMEALLAAMLQAPAHVYHHERGISEPGLPAGVRALTDHELASRLSYFLWNSMPDAELMADADAGLLRTDDGLRAAVQRMVASPRTEAKLVRFFSEWTDLDSEELGLADAERDPDLYPDFDPALADAMRTEFEALVRRVMFDDGEPRLDRFFNERAAYVNRSLADLYGVSGPVDDDTWEWVELDPSQRAGVLTRAAFLTRYGRYATSAPIRRGVYVLEEVLCMNFPDPPVDANDDPPQSGDDGEGPTTVREEIDVRTSGDDCQTCHVLINPAGFLFERYDGIGGWQDVEITTGLPVDSRGELPVSDVMGPMQDAVELSDALAQSQDARTCFAEKWVTGAFGVDGDQLDPCTEAEVIDAFAADGNIEDLLINIALGDSFRHVRFEE